MATTMLISHVNYLCSLPPLMQCNPSCLQQRSDVALHPGTPLPSFPVLLCELLLPLPCMQGFCFSNPETPYILSGVGSAQRYSKAGWVHLPPWRTSVQLPGYLFLLEAKVLLHAGAAWNVPKQSAGWITCSSVQHSVAHILAPCSCFTPHSMHPPAVCKCWVGIPTCTDHISTYFWERSYALSPLLQLRCSSHSSTETAAPVSAVPFPSRSQPDRCSAAQSSTSPAKHHVFHTVKDEFARNQIGRLIFFFPPQGNHW